VNFEPSCIGWSETLASKNFHGRAGCWEGVWYPCLEMISNAAMGTFVRKLGNAASQAIRRHSYYVCFGSGGSFRYRLCLVAQRVNTRLPKQNIDGSRHVYFVLFFYCIFILINCVQFVFNEFNISF